MAYISTNKDEMKFPGGILTCYTDIFISEAVTANAISFNYCFRKCLIYGMKNSRNNES